MASRRIFQARRSDRAGSDTDGFNLSGIAARDAALGALRRSWPTDDLGFLAEVFRCHHAPEPLIERLVATAASTPPGPRLVDRLSAALGSHFRFEADEDAPRGTLLLVGAPGVGKSTLAAKLAARLGLQRVRLASTDAVRPGGLAQLEEYARALGLPLAVTQSSDVLREVVAGATGRTVVIDSAGIAHDDTAHVEHLGGLADAVAAEPILVLPADCAADEATAMALAMTKLGARRMVVTRLDLARRIGGVLAAADATRLVFTAASVTPHFAYGLRPLTPEVLAHRLLLAALHDERWTSGAAIPARG